MPVGMRAGNFSSTGTGSSGLVSISLYLTNAPLSKTDTAAETDSKLCQLDKHALQILDLLRHHLSWCDLYQRLWFLGGR